MIEFLDVSKIFSGQVVLDRVSFHVADGEHVGIVGPNGAGKTTVFELLTGEISPDTGRISLPPNVRLVYIRQQVKPRSDSATLLEFSEDALPDLQHIQAEIDHIEHDLHREDCPDRQGLLARLGDLQTRFEQLGGYHVRHKAEEVLSGLGFEPDSFAQPFRILSGGWRMRAELARCLVAEADLLLLDEPSNYLDIPAIEWLQSFLQTFKGTLVLISHDRFLLNSLTSVTIEIANGTATRYTGNHAWYEKERVVRSEQQMAAIRNQDRKRKQVERFIERFRAKNTKASLVQSAMKKLERLERIEAPQAIRSQGRIRLSPPPHCGAEVIRLDQAGFSYDGARRVLQGVDLQIMRGDKVALVGLNGMGKTTLLRILAGHLSLSEGNRVMGHKVAIGYLSQEYAETMDPLLTAYETVKSRAGQMSDQHVRTLLGGFGFSGDAVEKPVTVLSGGEKIRLAFARLLVQPPNLLLLDEPTTHLDITARETLEEALAEYEGTLCLVSHDIEFVRRVATSIVQMVPPGIRRFPGGYDYFKEKTAGEQRAAQPTEATDPAPAVGDRKAKRRERAALIQRASRERNSLKAEIRKSEAEVEALEKEQEGLLGKLSATCQIGIDFAAINQRLSQIQPSLKCATARWEWAVTRLEEIERDLNESLEEAAR
jgi:ATP-binding cassette subfamily F protein 3